MTVTDIRFEPGAVFPFARREPFFFFAPPSMRCAGGKTSCGAASGRGRGARQISDADEV